MKIRKNLFCTILSQYTHVPPEQGGILGAKDDIICEYIHDTSSNDIERAVYIPNVTFLNDCINNWSVHDVVFCGMAHSHPAGQKSLSMDDIRFITKVYRGNPWLYETYFPLILNGTEMIVYKAEMKDGQLRIQKDSIEIVD